MDLLKPRERQRFGWPEGIALLVYCFLLFWCISKHESWFDEAQAWLIVRDSTLWNLLVHRLHYEGAPALWYLLLWVEIKLHISFLGMHYVAGAIAACGIFVWLRFNPLPRVLSLLFPFTYFLLYQYAVIARSYVLFPLLAFALMALLQNRKSKPIVFFLIAGLLANCSAHMAGFAVGIAIWYIWDRRHESKQTHSDFEWRAFAGGATVFLVLLGLAAATAWPTPDGSFGGSVINKIRSITPEKGHAELKQAALQDTSADDELPPPNQAVLAHKIWLKVHPGPDASAKELKSAKIIRRLMGIPTAFTAPIATWNSLAFLFLILLVLNVQRRQLWISLLPYFSVLVVFLGLWAASHHSGLLWIALVICIWGLFLPSSEKPAPGILLKALSLITLVVFLLQIGWSIHCLHADIDGSYSPAAATAAYIGSLGSSMRIAAFDANSDTVNAYLPHSPYFNQKTDYWPASRTSDPDLNIDSVLAQKPDIVTAPKITIEDPFSNQWMILDTPGTVDDQFSAQLRQDGYHATRRFCGQHLFRDSAEYRECRVIFEPVPKTASAPRSLSAR